MNMLGYSANSPGVDPSTGKAPAQLIVQRFGDNILSFVLQLPYTRELTVLQAHTRLSVDQRGMIRRQLVDFAECLATMQSDERRLETMGKVLYQMLLPGPIHQQLSELQTSLALLTDDPSLPWEILHDGEGFLALRMPFARQLLINEQVLRLFPTRGRSCEPFRRALIIANPTGDLPGARDEGHALAEFLREQGTCDLLEGEDANYRNVTSLLVSHEYSVIHYCGHIDYDPTEQLSSMRLSDGLLSATSVQRTFRGNPIVFLNACYSDIQPHGSEGGVSRRTESFARAFMMGSQYGVARALIGTLWRIPDRWREDGSAVFPETFYRRLLHDGATLGAAFRDAPIRSTVIQHCCLFEK